MGSVHWFIILLVSGLILVGGEIFLPGGIVGVIGGLALLGAVIAGFAAFPGYGPYIAVGILFLVGVAVALWIRIFPRTSVGRRMMVEQNLATAKASDGSMDAFAGKEGVAISELRPSGFAKIDGRRVDVVTRGEMIQKDRPVKVLKVEGNRVIVAEIEKSKEVV